jgi:AdoMet-dependent rRNA methyltransferase SPB1
MKKKNDEKSENPLIHREVDDDEDATNDAASRAAMWYQKEAFKDVDNDDDDDYENEKDEGEKENIADNSDDDDDDDDSDVDSDIDDRSIVQGNEEEKPKKAKGDTFEIAPQTKVGHLDEVGLAIGTAIATSRKRKRDIIDDSYHRYSYGKEVLPKWFTEDESKHKKRPLPVTREEVEAYKERMREINARPIKKVIEAKAKKKDKMLRKLEKVRKRAEGVLEASDTSEREKQQQIKGMYKRAGLLKKKREKVTYVVAKKSQAGKNYARPSVVKGQYKVVDPRLKKDLRAAKLKEKSKKRGKRKN